MGTLKINKQTNKQEQVKKKQSCTIT